MTCIKTQIPNFKPQIPKGKKGLILILETWNLTFGTWIF
jgi:hypothetical protein